MTQLRWLVTTYPEPGYDEIVHRIEMYAESRLQARKQLKKPDTKVLQYLNDNQEWVDVPTVTILGEVT